jgi:hypothetical protein
LVHWFSQMQIFLWPGRGSSNTSLLHLISPLTLCHTDQYVPTPYLTRVLHSQLSDGPSLAQYSVRTQAWASLALAKSFSWPLVESWVYLSLIAHVDWFSTGFAAAAASAAASASTSAAAVSSSSAALPNIENDGIDGTDGIVGIPTEVRAVHQKQLTICLIGLQTSRPVLNLRARLGFSKGEPSWHPISCRASP